MDVPTLKRFPSARFVVPLGCGRWLAAAGLEDIVELDWWQSTTIGDLEVTLVPARHWSMRMPWTRNQSLWGGFVYRSHEGSAYHAGDTAWFDGFAEIGRRFPGLDWAMLPVGGYAPRWFMEPQHVCPEEAAEAFLALGARQMVAMHWGTFVLTDEPIDEPPARARKFFEERKLDPASLWVPAIGEGSALRGTRSTLESSR
jgi:L-ascorbate metabolism protein UlaG (beta-lactamase superfamily)